MAATRQLCSLMGQGEWLGDKRYRRCRVSAFVRSLAAAARFRGPGGGGVPSVPF
jgi:hypothetical protein